MKHPARTIIALTLLATTLCAGRLTTLGPEAGAETRLPSEKLVARLTRGLSRTICQRPVVAQHPIGSLHQQPEVIPPTPGVATVCLSPAQYRLPPPAL